MPDTYCPECGASAKSTSKKCTKCGTILATAEALAGGTESTPGSGKTSKNPSKKNFAIGAAIALVAVLAIIAIASVSYSFYANAKAQEAAKVANAKAKTRSQKKVKDAMVKLADANSALAANGAQVKDAAGLEQYKAQVASTNAEAAKTLGVVKAEPEAFEKGQQKKVVAAVQANIDYLTEILPVLGDINKDYAAQLLGISEKQKVSIDLLSKYNMSIKWLPKVATDTWVTGFTQVGAIVTKYQDQLIQKAALEQAEVERYTGLKSQYEGRIFRPTYLPDGFTFARISEEKYPNSETVINVTYISNSSSAKITVSEWHTNFLFGLFSEGMPSSEIDNSTETLANGIKLTVEGAIFNSNIYTSRSIGMQGSEKLFMVYSENVSFDEMKKIARSMSEIK